jgi:CDP-diacylglycerol--glycerol-3-phosphate 3-phosphatidyltransferase/cardiolipin synthase
MDRGRFLSLPNSVSLSRIALAAAFVAYPGRGWRIALIAAAAVTDMLDGWLARRNESVTRWGALLDPITDRVFALAAVSSFLFGGLLTTGQYFTLISRDLATAVGFLVARTVSWLRPVAFSARVSGKIVTSAQLATLAAVLLYPPAVMPLVVLVGLASAWSIADYTLALWRARERAPVA